MLCRYLINSIKNNPVRHLLMILCQAVLLSMVFCASGILLDALDHSSNTSLSSSIVVPIENNPLTTSISEDKAKIDAFLSGIPDMSFCLMSVKPDCIKNQTDMLFAFNSYDDMVSYYVSDRNADDSIFPTREQYDNHEKLVMIGNSGGGDFNFTDENHILVGPGDDIYKVTGYLPNSSGIYLSYGSEPDGIVINRIFVDFKTAPTQQQIDEMGELAIQVLGAEPDEIRLPVLQDLLNLRKNMANIVLTVLLFMLIVFNTALIFRQLVNTHKTEFAVFSFCGFSKKTAVLYSLAEMMILSLISALAAVIIFEIFAKPIMVQTYGSVSALFTADYYVFLILAFMIVSLLMFLLCVAPILKKTAIHQLADI